MRAVLGLENLDRPLERSVVTIGKFFAVHRGHQALLRETVARARQRHAEASVFTFDRHPLELLRPGTALPIIASLEERLELIAAEGVGVTVVARLTSEFLALEPEAFVRDILVARLGVVEVLASDNFRFGRGARGDFALLRRLGEELGFTCTVVAPVMEGGERISSSRVARCIEAGQAAEAALLLGRPYALPGVVVHGDGIGRRLGFPTANVATPPERLHPANGVYLGTVRWDDQEGPAVVNLGVRPTRGGTRRVLEAHLLDWRGDLYGRKVRVEFLDRIRDEQQFPDLEALRRQIARDVESARGRA